MQALLVASSLVCCANGAQYTLRMLPDDKAKATNAVCLDGTNPGYYIRPGACVRVCGWTAFCSRENWMVIVSRSLTRFMHWLPADQSTLKYPPPIP